MTDEQLLDDFSSNALRMALNGERSTYDELRAELLKRLANPAAQPPPQSSLDDIAEYLDEQGIPFMEPLQADSCPMAYTTLERVKMLRAAQPAPGWISVKDGVMPESDVPMEWYEAGTKYRVIAQYRGDGKVWTGRALIDAADFTHYKALAAPPDPTQEPKKEKEK